MGSVYSTRFIDNAALSLLDVYTVPAAFVAVVRDIDVVIGVNIGAFEFTFIGTGGARLWTFNGPSSAGEAAQWRGRQVFQGGESFALEATGATFSYSACGYLLSA
jgi:hypothetical protein